jgi:hypothetical protein
MLLTRSCAEGLVLWVQPADNDWNNGCNTCGKDGLPSISAEVECAAAEGDELR